MKKLIFMVSRVFFFFFYVHGFNANIKFDSEHTKIKRICLFTKLNESYQRRFFKGYKTWLNIMKKGLLKSPHARTVGDAWAPRKAMLRSWFCVPQRGEIPPPALFFFFFLALLFCFLLLKFDFFFLS